MFASEVTASTDTTSKCEAVGLTGDALRNCEFDVQVSGDEKFVAVNGNAAKFMVVKNTQETSNTFSNNALTGATEITSLPSSGAAQSALNVGISLAAFAFVYISM